MAKTKNYKLVSIPSGSDNWWTGYEENLNIIDSLGDGYKNPKFPGDSTILYALSKEGVKIPALKLTPQVDGRVTIEIGRAGDTLVLKDTTYGNQDIQLPITVWGSGVLYSLGQRVRLYGLLFECTSSHRSTTFANDLINWVCLSQSAGILNQPAHGFTAFSVIRHNGTSWVHALADYAGTLSDPPTLVISANEDYFLYSLSGIVNVENSFTIGQVYYLSESAAGSLTTTEPSIFSNPIIKCISNEYISILPYRATEVL